MAKGGGDELQSVELATALHAQALTDLARRLTLLATSRAMWTGLLAPMTSLQFLRFCSERARAVTG